MKKTHTIIWVEQNPNNLDKQPTLKIILKYKYNDEYDESYENPKHRAEMYLQPQF